MAWGRASSASGFAPPRAGAAPTTSCCEPTAPHPSYQRGEAVTVHEDEDEEISSLGSLDLRGLRAQIVETDGDLIMVVDDGDVQVEFDSGMSGSWEQAILGAQRLA